MLIIIIIIAIALSMDAFSLSLIYGTLGMNKKTRIELSSIVGIYHFIMPILGYQFGKIVLRIIPIKPSILVGTIFLILGIQMLLSIKKDEKIEELKSIYTLIIFGFTVSIDSFTVGITLNTITNNIVIAPIIFSITSTVFTYIGTTIGKILNNKFGTYSILLGSILLIILSIIYYFS